MTLHIPCILCYHQAVFRNANFWTQCCHQPCKSLQSYFKKIHILNVCVCIGTNKKPTALSQRLILCEKLSCNIPLPQAWQVSSLLPNAALAPLTYSINPVILTHSTAMLGAEQSAGTARSRGRDALHLQQSPPTTDSPEHQGSYQAGSPQRMCRDLCWACSVGRALL